MKKSLLFFLLLLTTATLWAQYDFSALAPSGQTLYYKINSDGTSVTLVPEKSSLPYYTTKPTGDLIIPSTVTKGSNTYTVTSIGNHAFYDCSGLTGSITIPNSVTKIGADAFYKCAGLAGTVTIPNSVTSIIDNPFAGCTGITEINVVPDNPNYLSIDGILYNKSKNRLFGCPAGKIGSITIPNSVTYIGNDAFYYCSSLTGSLTIPNSVTSIGDYAFYYCSGLTGSLTIPNSVTRIRQYAFYYCSGLTGSLTIPNSVTKIDAGAFAHCKGLTGTLTIPNSVTSIGGSAFMDCPNFTGALTIPNSVTSIEGSAFEKCSGFTGTLTIPNSVTYIGNFAFSRCIGLTGTVTIPNSVTKIGKNPFSCCTGIAEINVVSDNPNYLSIDGILYNTSKDTLIGYPAGKTGSFTIPNSVTSIGDDAFMCCSGLTGTLAIPNSVTSIGGQAFRGCTGLTGTLIIPNSVTTIEGSAFEGCTGLTCITISNSVTRIGNRAFYDCSGLTAVYCEALTPPDGGGRTTQFYGLYNKIPLYVPASSIEAYKSHAVWGQFTTILSISTVSVSVNNASMGTATDGGNRNYCETITLTATPNTGYHFVKWSDENTDNPRTVTITKDTSFTAIFAADGTTYTVTIDVNDPSMGSVSGGGEYSEGETVTLIAIPKEGYHFVKWNDENTDNPRTITVTGETNLTAIFAINTYTVTATTDDASMGSVTGGGTYNHGETATLTAIPNAGYCFFGWSDGSTENPRGVTATQDSTITAIFDFKRRNHTATVCQGEAYAYQDSVFNTTTAGTFSKEVRFSNAYDCDSVVTVNLTVTAKSSATGIMLKDTCFEMGKATQLKVESPVATATYRFYDSHHALLHTGTEYTTAPLSSEEIFYVTMQEPSKCESAEKSITVSECVIPTHLFQLHKTVDNASVCKNSIVTITTVIEKLTPALIHKIQIIEDFGFADLKLLTAELKIDGKTVPYTRDVAHNKLFFNMGELSGIGTYTLTITARAFPNLGPKTETTTIRWANYPTGITETATFNVVD